MKKDLQKRLASYSRLAGAAAAIAPLVATGEIVYTDVDPDQTLALADVFEVDFNDDGVIDMFLGIGTATGNTSGGAAVYFQAAFASGSGAGSFAGSIQVFGGNNFYFPEAYNAGVNLDSTLEWQSPSAFGSLNYITSVGAVPSASGGNFESQTNKYLAVRFTLGAAQHYGWVRLSAGIAGPTNFLTVSGFAFEAVADEGIEAGAETGGVVPSGFALPDYSDVVSVYSFGQNVIIQTSQTDLQTGTVEVMDLQGRLVYAGTLNQGNANIQVDEADGLHLVRIRVADGVVNRKVYLSDNR